MPNAEFARRLSDKVKDLLGLRLNEQELNALTAKYYEKERGEFQEERFLRFLKAGVDSINLALYQKSSLDDDDDIASSYARASGLFSTLKNTHIEKFSKHEAVQSKSNKAAHMKVSGGDIKNILTDLRAAIFAKAVLIKGNSMEKKAFLLLSFNRQSYLTKPQFVASCLHGLSLTVTEAQAVTVFRALDEVGIGTITVKDLVDAALSMGPVYDEASDVMATNRQKEVVLRSTLTIQSENQLARVGYDKSVTGLKEPPPSMCRRLTIPQIEYLIADKATDNAGRGVTVLKTLMNFFSDTRDADKDCDDSKVNDLITIEQMRYSLWKRLEILISNDDIQSLFRKYDRNNSGKVSVSYMAKEILKKHNISEPLIRDVSRLSAESCSQIGGVTKFTYSQDIVKFLYFLRAKLKEITNRDGRAPHYLLLGSDRMTKENAKIFFEKKLGTTTSDSLLAVLLGTFNANGLIDMKRIIRDAMSLHGEAGVLGADTGLIGGSNVKIDSTPATLSGFILSPQKINELIISRLEAKCVIEMRNLISVFRTEATSNTDVSLISKNGMRRLLINAFDIYCNDRDFEAFFRSHENGEGYIEVKKLIWRLFPKLDLNVNPFMPKCKFDNYAERLFSEHLSQATGRRREVSGLNGPSYTRLAKGFIESNIDKGIDYSDHVDDSAKGARNSQFYKEGSEELFGSSQTLAQQIASRGEAYEQSLRAHAMQQDPPISVQIRTLQSRLEQQQAGEAQQRLSGSSRGQHQQRHDSNSLVPELSLAELEKEFKRRQESQPLTARPRTAAADSAPPQPAPPADSTIAPFSRQRPRTAPNPASNGGSNQEEDSRRDDDNRQRLYDLFETRPIYSGSQSAREGYKQQKSRPVTPAVSRPTTPASSRPSSQGGGISPRARQHTQPSSRPTTPYYRDPSPEDQRREEDDENEFQWSYYHAYQDQQARRKAALIHKNNAVGLAPANFLKRTRKQLPRQKSFKNAFAGSFVETRFTQKNESSANVKKRPSTPRFSYSGQKWKVKINPVRHDLMKKYSYNKSLTKRASMEYGLFVKSLTRAREDDVELRRKFDNFVRKTQPTYMSPYPPPRQSAAASSASPRGKTRPQDQRGYKSFN